MITGTVKWFNNAKGYGFICPLDNNVIDGDIFAHFSSINSEGYRTLKAGQQVLFDLGEGPKGFYAMNIKSPEDEIPEVMS